MSNLLQAMGGGPELVRHKSLHCVELSGGDNMYVNINHVIFMNRVTNNQTAEFYIELTNGECHKITQSAYDELRNLYS